MLGLLAFRGFGGDAPVDGSTELLLKLADEGLAPGSKYGVNRLEVGTVGTTDTPFGG